VASAAVLYQEALNWVRSSYPYWNASNGADHIWLFTHDEGACWAPAEVYNNSIILTHWGRTTPDNYPAHTGYGQDNYTTDVTDDPKVPQGSVAVIGHHPCYTAGKDAVIPLYKNPAHFRASPYMGAPQPPRDIFLFHRGRMTVGIGEQYSLGVRQKIGKLAQEHKWKERYGAYVGDHDAIQGDYSELLARSLFCLVLQGDGWSARFDDAVLHGCIPVIVIDMAVGPWGHQMQWDRFSVRIHSNDSARIPEILKAMSPEAIENMQRNLAQVWHRQAWLSHPQWSSDARVVLVRNRAVKADWKRQNKTDESEVKPWIRTLSFEDTENDAFNTLIQWLHYKLTERGSIQRKRL
jgi:hypothetical protein